MPERFKAMRIGAGHGFTLIELIVSIVILAIGVTAFMTLIHQTLRHSVDPMLQQQANAIAQSYMEEVLLNAFCDPDFSTDCRTDCTSADACTVCSIQEPDRAQFDDVCDYDGLDDTGARDRNDNPIAGLEAFNVLVTVDDSGVTLNGLSSDSGQILRVDVDVTHANVPGLDVSLTGYRVNF